MADLSDVFNAMDQAVGNAPPPSAPAPGASTAGQIPPGTMPPLTIHPGKRIIQGAPPPSQAAPAGQTGAPSATVYTQSQQQSAPAQPTPQADDPTSVDYLLKMMDDAVAGKLSPTSPSTQERPPLPLSQLPADIAQSAATGIEKGAINLLGAPADISTGLHGLVTKYLTGPVLEAILGPPPAAPPVPAPGTLGDIAQNTGKYLGSQGITKAVEAIGGPMYKPRSVPGDFAQTIGEFVPTAGRNVVTNAVLPGLADEAAGTLTKGTPLEEPARIGAALAAGSMGALGKGAAQGVKDYASAAPDIAAAQAAQRTGIDLPTIAVSNNPVVQGVGSSLKQLPIGGTPLRKASEKAIEQIGDARARAAAMPTGVAISPQSAGETLTKGLERYIGPTSKKQVSDLYDKVDAIIARQKPKALTPLSETQGTIGEIMAERAAAGLKGRGKAVGHVLGAVQTKGGLTYAGIKKLRTTVGEMLKDGRLPAETSEAELKRIYGALSKDLRQAVENAGGPDAKAAFARANKYAELVSDRRAALDRLLGTNTKSGESLTSAVQRMAGSNSAADAALLTKVRRSVSKPEWNEITSSVIGQLGLNGNGEFSPDIFLSDYGKLSAKGKAVLFNSTGLSDLPRFLDDIATVSQRFKQLQKFGNSSGTTQTAAGIGELSALGGAIASGTVAAPLAVVSGMIGANLMSKALAKPMSAAAIARWSKAYATAAAKPTPASVSAYKVAAQNLARTLAGIYDTRNDLTHDQGAPLLRH